MCDGEQFHGYGSGKKKQEKRLKMVEEEKKKERAMDLQRLKYVCFEAGACV